MTIEEIIKRWRKNARELAQSLKGQNNEDIERHLAGLVESAIRFTIINIELKIITK